LRNAAVLLAALCACGLVDPPTPPAHVVGSIPPAPGAPVPDPDRHHGTPSSPFPGYVLAWRDEFDGAALDEDVWTIDQGPCRDAVNARESVVVRDGVLALVTFTPAPGVHHTGHVNTAGKVEPLYGYFEARVRFFDSAGEWCSFFLYVDTIGNPKGDPGTAGVEIDVFEHRDADMDGYDIRDMVQVGVNWDGNGADMKRHNRLLAHPLGAPLSREWHTYAAHWTESGTTFYMDDIPVWSTTKAVSHREEPMYLTCEVKNESWAGYVPASGYGSLESSTTRMEVDWVRVWQRAR
jgi:beta-glucanase (GH16 family)